MVRRKNVAVTGVDASLDVVSNGSPEHAVIDLDFEGAVDTFLKEQRIRHRAARTIEWHRENLHTLKVFLERQGLSTQQKSITTKVLKEIICYTC